MPKLAVFSGKKVISILEKSFGFFFVSQKGSHVKLKKLVDGRMVIVIVPDHRELARGTLKNILRQAGVNYEEFVSAK
jgi:predicted RNA binding protein YcfA (HicA-like mRNA interferase family)